MVVHFDWLKLCYPGTGQPEIREQRPRRPPQSPLGVPVGTGLELVDDDSGETNLPTLYRLEMPPPRSILPSGGESFAPLASTSPGANDTSPHPSVTPQPHQSHHPHPDDPRQRSCHVEGIPEIVLPQHGMEHTHRQFETNSSGRGELCNRVL